MKNKNKNIFFMLNEGRIVTAIKDINMTKVIAKS